MCAPVVSRLRGAGCDEVSTGHPHPHIPLLLPLQQKLHHARTDSRQGQPMEEEEDDEPTKGIRWYGGVVLWRNENVWIHRRYI
jgi:hypothetical protein